MGTFEEHGGDRKDFDFRVGLAEGAWDCKSFADRLWGDVARILDVSFSSGGSRPSEGGGYNYWFGNDDLNVSMFVDDGEPGWPLEKVPAMLTATSMSEDVETWELAENLYERLAALGTYLLIVFEDYGLPIAANFDIGDDW
ncbi:hypothetical protein [Streptomyces sp. NBC_01637]|uniref:hypothetical protein n=1 Tax=unclassified Streptomyces TaxID=2593676 RepID=UPI00386C7D9A|nr:hypothetical protein OH719_28050 [Streptomyces sp. NBC_01653]WTD89502.1 hypothetical protein OG891_18820 [Streptomyces sp. NBC_01637]